MSGHQNTYFIGIALPIELSNRIALYKWRLHNEIVHTLKPLVPHITLLHPPSLYGVTPDELLPKIREISEPYLPLRLSLESIDAFDNTVLYIGICSPELNALQSRLVELLPPQNRELYYRRGFKPHVTLAQVRQPHSLDIEALRRRTVQEAIVPRQFLVGAISFFTKTHPRKYRVDTV